MVISAYLYHIEMPKKELWWLTAPGLVKMSEYTARALLRAECGHNLSWLQVLRCLPEAQGLTAEAWRMIAQDIEPMAAICREISCVRSSAITVDIDDVVRRFDAEMERALPFVGIP